LEGVEGGALLAVAFALVAGLLAAGACFEVPVAAAAGATLEVDLEAGRGAAEVETVASASFESTSMPCPFETVAGAWGAAGEGEATTFGNTTGGGADFFGLGFEGAFAGLGVAVEGLAGSASARFLVTGASASDWLLEGAAGAGSAVGCLRFFVFSTGAFGAGSSA
jgi:hypothetical protein